MAVFGIILVLLWFKEKFLKRRNPPLLTESKSLDEITGPVIVTHKFPLHTDELLAILMARSLDKDDRFEKAPVLCLTDSEVLALEARLPKADIRAFGIGSGPFNEHATDSHPRIENECCASLYAKFLGIEEDSGWLPLVELVRLDDIDPKELRRLNPDMKARWALFTNMFRTACKYWGEESLPAIEKAFELLVSPMTLHFNAIATGIEFEDSGITRLKFRSRFNAFKSVRLGAFESESNEALTWGLNNGGGRFNLVAVKRQSGQIQIMGHNTLPSDLVCALRQAELRKQGKRIPPFRELRDERCAVCPEWYYRKSMLFNGSATHPDVPPTHLTLDEIVKIIVDVMEELPYEECSSFCNDSRVNPCPKYCYGFSSCHHVRMDMDTKYGVDPDDAPAFQQRQTTSSAKPREKVTA